MPETYLAQVNRKGRATAAGSRVFDSGAEGIEILFDLDTPLPSGESSAAGLLWLTEKALDRTTETLRRVGVDPSSAEFADDEALCSAIVGKEFNLVMGLEQANQYHRVDKWIVRFINGPAPAPVGALARLRGKKAEATPAPSAYDDDVPF